MAVFFALCAILASRLLEPVEAAFPADVTNIAVGKTTYSSSQMPGSSAQKASDGDKSTLIDDCYRSSSQDSSPHWLIDLGKSYNIVAVKLTNTGDTCCAGNLHSLKIEVFTADPRRADSTETAQLCAEVQQAIPSRHTEQIQCKVSDTGKYIQGQWLRIMKNSKDLVICEVEIFESLPETSVSNFSCTFDSSDFCVFYASQTESLVWTLQTSLNGISDHTTGNGAGKFAVVDTNGANPGAIAHLPSVPLHPTSDRSCLIFWYALYDSEVGALTVAVSNTDVGRETLVWELAGGLKNMPQRNQWQRAAVTLDTPSPESIRVIFSVEIDAVSSDIIAAVDDIELTPGACPSELMVDSFSCTFEEADLCGLNQVTITDDYDWIWHSGSTESANTGPTGDHTTGNGHYLYTEASDYRKNQDQVALYSPAIVPRYFKSCLTFAYHMYGQDQGSLIVKKGNDPFDVNSAESVWSVFGNQGDGWKMARVELDTESYKPYKIFLLAILTGRPAGDTAVDDFHLVNTECTTIPSFSCTFDSACDLHHWSGSDVKWLLGTGQTPTKNTGPRKNLDGSYKYLESSPPAKPGDQAVLISSLIRTWRYTHSCLSFWYSMHGTTVGSLAVQTADPDLKTNTTIWLRVRAIGDSWQKVSMTIPTSEPIRIVFVGTVGDGEFGDIAIDSVELTKGMCLSDWGFTKLECDFDGPDLCGFQQSSYDDFDWQWTDVSTLDYEHTGPRGDHTTPKGFTPPGSYLFIESSSPQKTGDRATLLSPILKLDQPKYCLKFWYHMRGHNVGTLRVILFEVEQRDGSTSMLVGDPTHLWDRRGHQSHGWRQAVVELKGVPGLSKLMITATAGQGDSGDIAIDDIEMTNEPCSQPAAVEPNATCDFNEPGICGYTQPTIDSFDWTRTTYADLCHKRHSTYIDANDFINPALRRPATQSSRMDSNFGGPELVADGDDNTFWTKCAITDSAGARLENWWRVDLLCLFEIYSVIITNRGDCCGDRLYNFTVSVAKSLSNASESWQDSSVQCLYHEGAVGKGVTQKFSCSQPVIGRYVTVTTNHGQPLQICELEVEAKPYLGDDYVMAAEERVLKTAMMSPVLDWQPMEGTLTFKYFMSSSSARTLNVYAFPTALPSLRTLVWSGRSDGNAEWKQAEVDVNTPYPLQISFEAVWTQGDPNASIAVDDIKMVPGGDGHIMDCDFTDGMCHYENYPLAVMVWETTNGSTPQGSANDTGPTEDHTGGDNGRYLYINGPTATKGQTGLLAGPELKWGTAVNCLTFWYMMYNENAGVLKVYTASPSMPAVNRTELWSRDIKTDRRWHYAEVEFDASQPIRVYFEQIRGDSSPDNAIDDIVVRKNSACNEIYPDPVSTIDCNFENDVGDCGYTQRQDDDRGWILTNGTSPINSTGTEAFIQVRDMGAFVLGDKTGVLVSPEITWNATKACIRFKYRTEVGGDFRGKLTSMAGKTGHGTPTAMWVMSTDDDHSRDWNTAEMDIDLIPPVQVYFIAERMTGNIALDDVDISKGTCQPVPWQESWEFRCDRPTSPCVDGNGTCDPDSHRCNCTGGATGQQCQVPAGSGQCQTKSLCQNGGQCYHDGVGNACDCPDGYYGDVCQHKMVFAECTAEKMVVNVFPYGYTLQAFQDIAPPETSETSCPLLPVLEFLSNSSGFSSRGWQGYAREFLHKNDSCGGSATLLKETPEMKTYSRQLYVYYDPLGRVPTDTIVNVTCSTPRLLPPPKVTLKAKEYRSKRPVTTSVRLGTYIEVKFTLNIPNSAGMNDIKIERCTATNGENTRKVDVVFNGCAVHPVGILLFDGVETGTEFLILRVFKLPGTSLRLNFQCRIRLCDTRTDFSCFKRPFCLRRKKRSSDTEAPMEEGNIVSVNYTYTDTG